jgi:hypothetical protein
MTEVVMLQAAMFQLRSAMESIEDPFIRTQMQLAVGVLGTAVDGAANGVNAATVNDIDFALNDVAGAVADLPQSEAASIEPLLAMLRNDVDALKSATALPADVVDGIRALQAKLKVRKNAIERQTYVENAAAEPLPHAPEDLRAEALPLRDRLASAGFATPALDTLIGDPTSIRFHSINEILDELDVIVS